MATRRRPRANPATMAGWRGSAPSAICWRWPGWPGGRRACVGAAGWNSPPAWPMPFALLPPTLLLIAGYGGHCTAPTPGHVLTYLLWAILQQWLMLAVVLRRLEGGRQHPAFAVLLAALVFALMHTPNGILMQLCLLAELWWVWCF